MHLAGGTVAERVATLRERVDEVAAASGRERGSVSILAVTKAQPRDAVRLDPAPVRRDEHVAGDARLRGVDADGRQRALDERDEIRLADAGDVSQR